MGIERRQGKLTIIPEKPKKNFFKPSEAYRVPDYTADNTSYLMVSLETTGAGNGLILKDAILEKYFAGEFKNQMPHQELSSEE